MIESGFVPFTGTLPSRSMGWGDQEDTTFILEVIDVHIIASCLAYREHINHCV